jgi:AcrR family transcriptional regulator
VSDSADHVQLPVSNRVRRSQSERRAETRGRILAAVLESIEEMGLTRTTAAEIARRAGVTWGAVQHHYGDKRGILVAVLQESTNRFIDQLARVEVEGRSLEERVDAFVRCAWEHFSSAHYHCTVEILLHLAGEDPVPDLPRSLAELQGPSWAASWSRIFHDSPLPPRRSVALQRYAASVLSGLASFRILEGGDARLRELELGFLKETLLRELGGDTGPSAGGSALLLLPGAR